jgi:peptidoglycan/LPS O-acetylase OafA/YrhL
MPKRPKDESRVYFPGLHGLRFFAAMMVVFSHVELMKDYHGFANAYDSSQAVYESGRLGVTLFFVLSGFLISYLLLAEQKISGTISIRKFYSRRILRIWPLYFLLILITFVVVPRLPFFAVPTYTELMPQNLRHTFPLYVLLLPQVALSIWPPVPFAEPLWSIGVEEQFYLAWPILMKHVRRFLLLTILIIVGALVLKQAAFIIAEASRATPGLKYWNYLISYLYFTRIECMAVGGAGAWLVFAGRRKMLKAIYHPASQLVLYGITACLLITDAFKPVYNYLVYAVCFCLIILNVATNPRSLIKIENRAYVFLGNISFSIYMFHELAIQAVMQGLVRVNGTSFTDTKSNVLLYALSLGLTLMLATMAYYGFERMFLRLKHRFAVIDSGPAPA